MRIYEMIGGDNSQYQAWGWEGLTKRQGVPELSATVSSPFCPGPSWPILGEQICCGIEGRSTQWASRLCVEATGPGSGPDVEST